MLDFRMSPPSATLEHTIDIATNSKTWTAKPERPLLAFMVLGAPEHQNQDIKIDFHGEIEPMSHPTKRSNGQFLNMLSGGINLYLIRIKIGPFRVGLAVVSSQRRSASCLSSCLNSRLDASPLTRATSRASNLHNQEHLHQLAMTGYPILDRIALMHLSLHISKSN